MLMADVLLYRSLKLGCLLAFLLTNLCMAGCIRMVKGEGMPQYRNPFEKGDLYIKFDVQFPENNWISPEKLNVS